MYNLFREAAAFNQPLDQWNLSSVSSTMGSVFYGASNFSQNLCAWNDVLPQYPPLANMFEGTACPEPETLKAMCYECV